MAKLGEICTIYSGTGFPVQYQGNSMGKYPFYKVGDIARNVTQGYIFLRLCENFIDEDVCEMIKGTIIPENTIVFAKIGEAVKLNRRAITTKDSLIDNNAMGIKPNEAFIALRYFYHFMCRLKLEEYAEATTVPSVKKTTIEKIDIPLPTLETQRKIAANLDKVTHTIDLCNAILEKLDLLVKSRFVEMFGTLETPVSGFEYDTLKNLCRKITDGKHGGCSFEEGTSFYFVGAREIYDDSVHYDTAPEITAEDFYKDYKRCNIEKGDFLIVNTGATIGKSAIATDDRTEHTLLQKSVALMKAKKEKLLPIFLMYCYKVNDRMYRVESASAQPNLLLSKINATKIYVPPLALQQQFAAFVEQTDKSKLAVKQVLEKAEMLKKALMQKYFG